MPILLPYSIDALSEQDFHKMDYSVMALAFEVHNQLGRFYDEDIYKNKLMQKCRESGFETACEVQIKLAHQDFSKHLFIDLLVNDSVYEQRAPPVPRKLRYHGKDLQDWARHYGLEIGWPDVFPVNSVKAMRGCLVAQDLGRLPEFARACFELYWGEALKKPHDQMPWNLQDSGFHFRVSVVLP